MGLIILEMKRLVEKAVQFDGLYYTVKIYEYTFLIHAVYSFILLYFFSSFTSLPTIVLLLENVGGKTDGDRVETTY